MKITRIYTGKDGESHFEDIEILLNEAESGLTVSEVQKTKGIMFIQTQGAFDFHKAPARQYVIFLDGNVEVETGSGEKRTFNAGDILLAEDTTGRGHKIYGLDNKPRRAVFITLEQD
jgi:quercetin dioxygenase-like cupin family protein